MRTLLAVLLLAGCSKSTPPLPPGGRVPTDPLEATPTRVDLAALPRPFATMSANRSARVESIPAEARLRVPPGFTVNVYVQGLNKPRWLARTPDGAVLVTETPDNRIRLLRDRDGDGVADSNDTFADGSNGLAIPFGMAFAGGSFFVGNSDAVLRFPYQAGQTRLEGAGQKITDLPGGGYNQHWTRNVVASADGSKLYVSVGSKSNVDVESSPRAEILVMGLDGSGRATFASGLRNPVGLAVHPRTGALHATVNERDGLGDDLVPDYFTRVEQGEFYGWPYAYLRPDLLDPRRVRNGVSEAPQLAARTRTPDVLFQAHSAALGVAFYDGETFPAAYRGGAFVAFRGSWNRSQGTGYKLVFVPFTTEGRPEGSYQDFLTGFLTDPSGPSTWGRPVGVLQLGDGSLLFTEEANGRIYRVQYSGG
jgi:glucose/arabinose dehydrogenase